MKRQLTANQPAPAGEVKAEMQSANTATNRKVVYNHKAADHSHGRVNRHAIGINHEPGLFS